MTAALPVWRTVKREPGRTPNGVGAILGVIALTTGWITM